MTGKYPTQQRLKELFTYDPESGLFYWAEKGRNRKMGVPVGSKAPNGYLTINPDYCGPLLAHRLVWLYVYGVLPDGCIDHINGIRTDNRLCNLRSVTHTINCQNRRSPSKNSKTQLLGTFRNNATSFRAVLMANGKKIELGLFKSAELAHAAYIKAKRINHEGCTI